MFITVTCSDDEFCAGTRTCVHAVAKRGEYYPVQGQRQCLHSSDTGHTNLMLGLKWRMALYQAEALRDLNDGQYGSRPRRNAFDPVFIEEMQFEISRASRKMLVQTNYDAM
jgi:hypothetical protein